MGETDQNGNPGSMISAVQLEVPNYRVRETIEDGKEKVNGTLDCTAMHNLKMGNKYATAHTVKTVILIRCMVTTSTKWRTVSTKTGWRRKRAISGGMSEV